MTIAPRVLSLAAVLASSIAPVAAQGGLLPNGDFTQGTSGWNNIRFNDPLGSTGVAPANVSGAGISPALFADFRSASGQSMCNWLSDYHQLPPGVHDVSLQVMWHKPSAAVIGDPSGNYIEVFLLDANSRHVFSSHLPVRRTATLVDRRTFRGVVTVPVTGNYRAHVIMAHSAAANLSYTAWVDDIVVGSTAWSLSGSGCPGTGGYTPDIGAHGTPAPGSIDWELALTSAYAPTLAILCLGTGTTSWQGTPLPYAIGGGCMLQVQADWSLFASVSGSTGGGLARIPIAIPPSPVWSGLQLHAQWVVVDPGSGSPYGVTMTRSLTFVVQ